MGAKECSVENSRFEMKPFLRGFSLFMKMKILE
jgi:hypothetical protein